MSNVSSRSSLREVDISLRLQGIEGDAVFLYAEYPGSDVAWREALAEIRIKLLRFFEVFYEGVVTAIESTPCECAVCKNVEDLAYQVVGDARLDPSKEVRG